MVNKLKQYREQVSTVLGYLGLQGRGEGDKLRERDCGEVVPETLQYYGIINLQVLRKLTDGKECSVPHDLLLVPHS